METQTGGHQGRPDRRLLTNTQKPRHHLTHSQQMQRQVHLYNTQAAREAQRSMPVPRPCPHTAPEIVRLPWACMDTDVQGDDALCMTHAHTRTPTERLPTR